MKISVILPTYNEKYSIIPLITELLAIIQNETYTPEIILVDDNSPDNTYQEVITKFGNNPDVRAFLRRDERGLATAILFGIRQATGDKVVVMDTDFNHPPKLIPLLIAITQYFDIAIGSRYVTGGGMETSRFRYLGSKLFNLYSRLTLGIQTRDNLSGFFCFTPDIIMEINQEAVFKGYGDYFIRFLYAMQRLKKPIIEVPVVYKDRQGGLSKTNLFKEFGRYAWTVIKTRWSGRQLLAKK
ncbi:MAG: glycosyltransferase [Bacteroidales bacterium]|nr:glycosyltransferase [Deltaproteobacteria bacterium]MBL7138601.1 glycosyltransferase [Bacteroidales bacterium]